MLIASRTLTWRDGERDVPVEVRVFAPAKESSGAWGCCFEIDWPDKQSNKTTFGVDSVQSLVLALQMIATEIYTSSYHQSRQLYFDKPGNGYGFPVVPSYRDLLVGDDKKYF